MMETQIFYWTGVVVWWGICLTIALSVSVAAVIAPLFVFHRVRKVWWKWATFAKFLNLGWTQEDLKNISWDVGGVDDYWLEKTSKIIKAAEKVTR